MQINCEKGIYLKKYLQNIPTRDDVARKKFRAASRNAVVAVIIRFNQDCYPRVNSTWEVDKEVFSILSLLIQPILTILTIIIPPF